MDNDEKEKRPMENQEPLVVAVQYNRVAEKSIANEPCKHKKIMRGDKLLMEIVRSSNG